MNSGSGLLNEFYTYEILCTMSNIAQQYTDSEDFGQKVRRIADRIASRQYRVAVIGEFKRGKSSLINALLGTQILPTDILPMTAAITHIKYSDKKKILINYKTGESEERSVDQLIDFATKYDEEKEKTAAKISSILVEYPSVFCKNHIEIIDTPGMNDEDKMTKITLSVLGEIDAAIMVISAKSPLSLTEQSLIITMIKEQGIHHIFFVVTYIDSVSDEEEEKDKMISFIKKRISKDLLARAQKAFDGDEMLTAKAERILSDPDVLGVSSVQAISGFMRDDSKLLKTSRFPVLKNELLSFLTAAQSEDITLNSADAFVFLNSNLEKWKNNELVRKGNEKESISEIRNKYEEFLQNGKSYVIDRFMDLDNKLKSYGCFNNFEELAASLKKIYIKKLTLVRRENNNPETIADILNKAHCEANEYIESEHEKLAGLFDSYSDSFHSDFISICPGYSPLLFDENYLTEFEQSLEEWKSASVFPEFSWVKNPGEVYMDTKDPNIMPIVTDIIKESCEKYYNRVDDFLCSWRVLYFRAIKKIKSLKNVVNEADDIIERINIDINIINANYASHCKKMKKIEADLAQYL